LLTVNAPHVASQGKGFPLGLDCLPASYNCCYILPATTAASYNCCYILPATTAATNAKNQVSNQALGLFVHGVN
jgi:hypothetical protein